MRDVFFSFLGTTPYTPVHYALREHRSTRPEFFVQAALVEALALPDLHVVIAVTNEARRRNWDALARRLREFGVEPSPITIPDGRDEGQLWEIFQRIGQAFEPGDRVHMDLTHGFRSLPATAVMALGFFRHARDLDLRGLYYGAFEALLNNPATLGDDGKPFVIAKDLGDWQTAHETYRTAPVFDLTAMFDLPAWAEGVAEWRRTGRADGLVARTAPYLRDLQRALGKARPAALCDLPDALRYLDAALALVRHDHVAPAAQRLAEKLAAARAQAGEHPSLAPLVAVTDALDQSVRPLLAPEADWRAPDGAYLRHQVAAARWYRERHRVPEALTALREAITSCAVRVGVEAGVDALAVRARGATEAPKRVPPSDGRYRGALDWWLQCFAGVGRKAGPPDATDDPDAVARVGAWLAARPAVTDAFRDALDGVQTPRNKIHHAWTGDAHSTQTFSAKTLGDFDGYVVLAADRVDALLAAIAPAAGVATPAPAARVFVNLSNHPVAQWSLEQRDDAAALGLGAPADLDGAVPLVPPDADTADVRALAETLAARACAQGAAGAMVSGEPTLTVALVAALQARGVRCFAATTERVARETVRADGTTVTEREFRFRRWREFPAG